MRGVFVFALLACSRGAAFGQNPQSVPRLEFEVASVKPSPPGEEGCVLRPAPGGQRYVAACLPLRPILFTAFWLKPSQVVGGPTWLDSDRYDIEGLASWASSIDELHIMMQNLLADRFKLQFHHETKELPAYVLTVDKSGPKNLKKHETGSASDLKIETAREGLHQKWSGTFARMDFLAWRLSQTMDRPVIDQTGLTGGYDFNLAFTDDPPPIRAGNAPVDPLLLDTSGQNVFEALRSQLGLRLEARRTPVDILVIDHAERPTEN